MTHEEIEAIRSRDARCAAASRKPTGNPKRDGFTQAYRDRRALLREVDRLRRELERLHLAGAAP